MKFALALLAIVATATAKIEIPNFGKGELHKDIQDFLNLMPVDQIVAITLKYVGEDAEFQNMLKYFKGEEFKGLVKDVEGLPEVRELMNYLEKAGIYMYKMVNRLNDLLGLDHLTPPQILSLLEGNDQATKGIRGYIDEIEAILPVEKLRTLYKQKLETSKAFADFVNQLKSPNFQKIVNSVYANEKFKNLLSKAAKAGIDLKLIKDLLKTILGIDVPSRSIYNY